MRAKPSSRMADPLRCSLRTEPPCRSGRAVPEPRVSGFTVIVSVLVFGSLFGVIGAIIGVPIAAGLQIIAEELTAARRARIAAADAEAVA